MSGSIGDFKGALYGAVLNCQAFVHHVIHLFSAIVADVSLGQLRRGECRTTSGTAIDCVAEHMRCHGVRRAAIITDGYVGSPEDSHAERLGAARLGVALTPGAHTRVDLGSVADRWTEPVPQEGRGS